MRSVLKSFKIFTCHNCLLWFSNGWPGTNLNFVLLFKSCKYGASLYLFDSAEQELFMPVVLIVHDRYELLFYPRFHLDQSSLLCRKPLLAKPMVMDVYQEYILVTYRPFDVHIFHVKLVGELTPTTPDLQVNKAFQLLFLRFL